MNKRQFQTRVKYLRNLYTEMEEVAQTTRSRQTRTRAAMLVKHLKVSVSLLFDMPRSESKRRT